MYIYSSEDGYYYTEKALKRLLKEEIQQGGCYQSEMLEAFSDEVTVQDFVTMTRDEQRETYDRVVDAAIEIIIADNYVRDNLITDMDEEEEI